MPIDLLAAFWAYERALMANDLVTLDALFAPGPDTLRGDAAGILLGHSTISAFRDGRGGAPMRTIGSLEVRPISDDAALIVAVTLPATGGRGQQTQLWRRGEAGWVVEAAHVSAPAPAINGSVWRTVGTPLVAPLIPGFTEAAAAELSTVDGAVTGPLAGQTVAVKDLFAVKGHATGGGVPAWLAEAHPATDHSPAVLALLEAGASVVGIAQTDEFAYSIAGKNPHYGTPPNAAVPGAISGGSSSGPASAVALGQATIGLGTDTGGSIRVPASYQGLWGLRTTLGAVSVDGVLPLASSFDTVGWLTRDARTLRGAAAASMSSKRQVSPGARFAVSPALVALATDGVQSAFGSAIESLVSAGLLADLEEVDLGDLDKLFETFRTVQGAEAWREHGDWIQRHPHAIGEDIAARFAWASTITAEAEALSRSALMIAEARIAGALDERVLLLPSASSVAPSTTATGSEIEAVRAGTLRMTAIAGISRRPALSVPMLSAAGPTSAAAPVGLCLVGPRFSDLALVDIGEQFAAVLGR